MGRVLAVFLLSMSLTAFAQDQQVFVIPATVNLQPAVPVYTATTPLNVLTQPVLPGQTAMVVPTYVTATPLVPSGPPLEAVMPSAPAAAASESAVAPNVTFVRYAATAAPAPSRTTVAEAAAHYRANKDNINARVFDNNSLAALDQNPSGLTTANQQTMPQSDVTPESGAAMTNARPEHAAAGDVLDPRDLAAVESAVRRSEQQGSGSAQPAAQAPSASARYDEMTRQAEAQSTQPSSAAQPAEGDQSPSQVEPQQANTQQTSAGDRLPDTSSTLPFIGLLGFLGLAGGVVGVLRSRL